MSETSKTEAPPELHPPPRMSAEEIKELALGIVTNRVFITNNPEIVRMSFLVVMLAGVPPETGMMWEEYDKAGERGINGYPMFFSCNLVHIEDCEALLTEVRQMMTALGMVIPDER